MTEFYGINTDAHAYAVDYRRQTLTAAYGRRPVLVPLSRNSFWRRMSLRTH